MTKLFVIAIVVTLGFAFAPSGSAQTTNGSTLSTEDIIARLTPQVGAVATRGLALGVKNPESASAPLLAVRRNAHPSLSFDTITFETNSARLSLQSVETLQKIGQALASARLAPHRFQIIGHTDARGSARRNLTLSKERAQAVVQYLVESFHFDRERFVVLGKGAQQLRNKAAPASGENRRVELVNLGP